MHYNSGSAQTMEAAKEVDIIHISYHLGYISEVRKRFPNKKIILTCCGSDIRDKWGQEAVERHYKKADLVTVKTKDLLLDVHGVEPPDGVILTPIPIDRDFWTRTVPYEPGTALRIQRWHHTELDKRARDFCNENDLKLTMFQRSGYTQMRIEEFYTYLQQFEYYIDVKGEIGRMLSIMNDPEYTSLSGTALQFLALGGKVFYWNRIINEFPIENDAEIQAVKWYKIYQELLN